MEVVDRLVDQHRLILRALAVAEAMARTCRRDDPVPTQELDRLLEFLRGYLHDHHHALEEEVLFPWMTRSGHPGVHAPLACMRGEHQAGHELVARLAEVGHRLGDSPGEAASLLEALAGHLRAHIRKEDMILFPMAEQLGDGDEELRDGLAARTPSAPAEAYHRELVEELEARFPAG